MSTLPKGWEELSIGEVIIPFKSIDPTKEPSKEFRYIDIGSIDNSRQVITDPKTFKGKDAPSRARRVVQDGDVLFSTIRTYLKNIATVPSELSGAMTSTGIAVLRPSTRVDCRYLFHWVTSDAFITEISKSQDGTMYPAVSDRDVSSSRIAVPPVIEQRRVVAKLDSLTGGTARAREELGRIPRLIQKYRDVILATAFSGELTREWRVARALPKAYTVNLGSAASAFSYGSAAKSSPTGEVPVLRMGNIQDGSLNWSDLVFTSNKDEITKYDLRAGDVLFNRTNSPALVGKTALYRGERPAIYAGYLIRIRCSPAMMPEFLTYCLNSPAGRNYCWRVKTDGVSQSNFNAKKLAAFQLPLPTVEEQQEIVRRIETAFAWLDRVTAEHANASRLLPKLDQAILAKAFRGELVLSARQPRTLTDAEL